MNAQRRFYVRHVVFETWINEFPICGTLFRVSLPGTGAHPMEAYDTSELGEPFIICDDHAPVACHQILACVKAKTAGIPESTRMLLSILCTDRVGSIFDDHQMTTSRDLKNSIHIARLACHMDWNDCLGPRRDPFFDKFWRYVKCGSVYVHEHWSCALVKDGVGSSGESDRASDYFIPLFHPSSNDSHMERGCA